MNYYSNIEHPITFEKSESEFQLIVFQFEWTKYHDELLCGETGVKILNVIKRPAVR